MRRGRRPVLPVGAGAADGGEDGGVAVAVLAALLAFAAAGGTCAVHEWSDVPHGTKEELGGHSHPRRLNAM